MATIMKNKLAIFDLDGTLFDTREVNYYAYQEALQPFGINLDHAYFTEQCNGHHYQEFLPKLLGNREHIEEIHQQKKEAYAKNLDKAKKNSHLFQFIQAIRAEYHTAIVTSASKQNVIDILTHFHEQELFDLYITQEDVNKVKPNPEGFLKAMEYFQTTAENTVIFEDSAVGIEAAQKSGASVFVVKQF